MSNWQQKLNIIKRLIRLDKPIGTYLLLWPTLSALWLAGEGRPPALIVCIFILGVFCTRAAGCVINDICDRNFDRYVERTQSRPLAQNEISLREAIIVCAVLLLISFILVLQLNRLCLFIAIASAILMAIYPLMKRFFLWPQVVLGAIFNGVLMAFAAIKGSITWSGGIFYLASWLWTISYDSFYAMADQKDDQSLGLKSTAIFFGEKMPIAALIMQGLILILLIIVGMNLRLNHWYYFGITATALTFAYQQYLITQFEPARCFKAFLNNNWSWCFLFLGIFLNYLP